MLTSAHRRAAALLGSVVRLALRPWRVPADKPTIVTEASRERTELGAEATPAALALDVAVAQRKAVVVMSIVVPMLAGSGLRGGSRRGSGSNAPRAGAATAAVVAAQEDDST